MRNYTRRKLLALLLIFTVSIQPIFTSFAYAQTQAVADDRQGKNPHVDRAANGTTVVNIRKPNAAGLSHNQYLNLQVGPNGIIFNNATGHANTQLAGYIMANPNLAGVGAKRILNEVTGSIPTHLNGYMEIAGNRADLIIANPNGIVGNNFGFINANRAVMTTGIPQLDGQGNLKSFLVNGGDISISGQGMDATGSTKTEIIAQAVRINAALHANDLSITTGTNEVDYETGQAKALSQEDTGISLDVGALGSMYANSIMLIGTSKGLGVNNQGNIIANQGNLTITQEGKVVLAGNTQAKGNLNIATQADIVNEGTIYAQKDIALSAQGNIDNNDGLVRAENKLSITTRADVLNSKTTNGGQLEAGNISIKSNNLDSTGNILAFGQDLTLNQAQNTNLSGTTYAEGDLTADVGGNLTNDGGLYTEGNLIANIVGNITNTGSATAKKNLALTAEGEIINSDLIAAVEAVSLTASGDIKNLGTDSSIEGSSVQIKSADYLSEGNTYALNGDLKLEQSRQINLIGDTYAAKNLTAKSGQDLLNQGTLYALGLANLNSNRNLINQGTIQANNSLNLSAQNDLINQGTLYTNSSLNLSTQHNINNQGSIFSKDFINITAQNNVINQGLIKSDAKLILNANGSLGNTGSGESVIEAASIELTSASLDNTNSLINALSDEGVTIQTGNLNNSNGQILSQGDLDLTAVALSNNNGIIYADGKTDLNVSSLAGNGQVLSQDDLTLTVSGNLDNQGEIKTNANLTVNSTGNITNSNTLAAANALNITTQNLTNQGTLQANQLTANVNGTLSNIGLINSANDLKLTSQTLTNNSKGRIYGTDVYLKTTTLNNLGDGVNAPVIASRNNFYLGAQTINNKEHALILSEGDMFIGGTLNSEGQVVGSAVTINNNSATIEAKGNLVINAGTINNTNERFEVEAVKVSEEKVIEYQKGGMERFQVDGDLPFFNSISDAIRAGYIDAGGDLEVKFGIYTVLKPCLVNVNTELYHRFAGETVLTHLYSYTHLFVPGEEENIYDKIINRKKTSYIDPDWVKYEYTRTIYEDVIKSSDPGKILSGQNMLINATNLINDKSQVVAGGNLTAQVTNLKNNEFQGSRKYVESGTITKAVLDKSSLPKEDWEGIVYYDKNKYYSMAGYATTSYTEELAAGQVAIGGYRFEGNAAVDGSNEKPQYFTGTIINEIATEKRYISSIDFGADGSTINNIIGQLNNSLYIINTRPTANYFIETDPAFTNYGKWVSSEYFFTQLNFDPASLAKRLGDAYYEQQLIKEQILQLTGNRYVKGFADDNEQYQSLLDSAVKFAQENNVVVGVELTAEQVANLTESIVWMVEKQVLLPDGQVVTALVPQVYLVEDDKQNFGSAVISGQNIDFNVTNDILNSGTIKASDTARLSATNINNIGGRIQATDLGLLAINDINNIGGSLTAQDSMLLSAGNNINIETTTFTQTRENNSGINQETRTTTGINSLGSVTLTGDNASLVMQAGNNVNLKAAQISNQGDNSATVIQAENNVNLSTIVLSEQADITSTKNSRNSYSSSWSKDVGTTIATGDLTISAGNDLTAKAATIVADNVDMQAGNNLSLTAGQETFEVSTTRGGGRLFNYAMTESYSSTGDIGTVILADGNINLAVGNDLTAKAAVVAGGEQVNLTAGNDVNIISGEESQQYNYISNSIFVGGGRKEEGKEKIQVNSVVSGGDVNIRAGNDVNIKSSVVAAENDISVQAANDINITAEKDFYSSDVSTGRRGSSRFERNMESHDTLAGSLLTAGNNISLASGNDLTIKGSGVQSEEGKISLSGESVNILSETENHEYLYEYERKKRGTFSKKSTKIYDYQSSDYVVGSNVYGNEIEINSGKDTNIEGSHVIAMDDLSINAGGDINIASSEQNSESYYKKEVKKSGFMSGGSFGFSIGKEQAKTTQTGDNTEQVGSIVGSLQGNVSINAGSDVNIEASAVFAGQDIDIEGDNVNIVSKDNVYNFHDRFEYKKSGLTVSLGGSSMATINSVLQPLQRAREVSEGRTKALYGIKSGMGLEKAITGDTKTINALQSRINDSVKDIGKTIADGGVVGADKINQLNQDKTDLANAKDNAFGGKNTWSIDISFGSTKYTSNSNSTTTIAEGSGVSAGGDVNIKAREKDINIIGSEVSGKNVTLEAKENVNIEASANTNTSNTDSKSSSSSIGLSVNLGTGQVGAFGSYSRSKGQVRENGTAWNSSKVKAEDTLTIKSGQDTNIIGSQVEGDRVEMQVGGDLNIESLQDKERYKETNTGGSIGISVGPGGNIGVSGGGSKQKIDSDYASVNEQAGVYAGEGGFDIYVEGNTDLKGAVIASEADAEDNRLSTGTLTYSDIENHAEWEANTVGVNVNHNFGNGRKPGDAQKPYQTQQRPENKDKGVTPNIAGSDGDASSVTKSAIAEGEIEIRDNPDQDISDLSRDTGNANNPLEKIFDRDKILENQEAAALFGEIGFKVAGDIIQKMGWEGKPEAAALHALIGGIMAEINGGEFGEGMTVAAVNELIMARLRENTELSTEEARWISSIIGVIVSEAVGGNIEAGASTTDSATRNNWLEHEHNVLMDELKDQVTQEELDNMKLGNKDADRVILQLNDSQGHSMPPAEAYYGNIRRMLEDGHITETQAIEYIEIMRNEVLKAAENEFVTRLEYAISYHNQGNINDSAAYWFGSAVHVVQDIEAHWRLGEDGGWVGHALGFLGLAPSPDDPQYLPERFERSKIHTNQAWAIYQNALKTGVIDRTETAKLFSGNI